MAGFLRRKGSSIARACILITSVLASSAAAAQLYDQPILVVDPGMHTAQINDVDIDAAERLAFTGSLDKTVRVWSLPDGRLVQTIRIPAGPGEIGKIYTIAMNPNGDLIAAAGWTKWSRDEQEDEICLFEARSGKVTARMGELPGPAHSLAFSPDGRYLAAGLGSGKGLRVYDRDRQWEESFRDTNYSAAIYGLAFARSGRLGAAARNGRICLYDPAFRFNSDFYSKHSPFKIAFNPSGTKLAVGLSDVGSVDVFDVTDSLSLLESPDLGGAGLSSVAWSKDGDTVYSGGNYGEPDNVVLAWADATRGHRSELPAASNTIMAFA